MIVVDSNVLAYLYLPREHTAAAEAPLEHDPEWAAPILWRSEFRNILAGYLRRKNLTFEQALNLQHIEHETFYDGWKVAACIPETRILAGIDRRYESRLKELRTHTTSERQFFAIA